MRVGLIISIVEEFFLIFMLYKFTLKLVLDEIHIVKKSLGVHHDCLILHVLLLSVVLVHSHLLLVNEPLW